MTGVSETRSGFIERSLPNTLRLGASEIYRRNRANMRKEKVTGLGLGVDVASSKWTGPERLSIISRLEFDEKWDRKYEMRDCCARDTNT